MTKSFKIKRYIALVLGKGLKTATKVMLETYSISRDLYGIYQGWRECESLKREMEQLDPGIAVSLDYAEMTKPLEYLLDIGKQAASYAASSI